MASIGTLYPVDGQRERCYSCPSSNSGGAVKYKGKKMHLECRQFTEIGNAMETITTAQMTDIFQTKLIHVRPIGVDDAKMSFGRKMKLKAQSRGGGGVDKYTCKKDFQVPKLIKHDKKGFTEMIYVHVDMCPKEFISTELQDMVFQSDSLSDAYDVDNALSDMIILSARETVAEHVQYVDITGIFKGPDEKANAYDGILAQALYAYKGYAYFQSIKYTMDTGEVTDGTYIHMKYGGATIAIQFDSTEVSDPDINLYATHSEVLAAMVVWLNTEAVDVSGRRFVDATYSGNDLYVTSKFAEYDIPLQMTVSSTDTLNWVDCDIYRGFIAEQLQACMPIDERPVLLKWRAYTESTVLTDLVEDIYTASCNLDNTLLRDGQKWAIYIDDYLLKKYRHALKTRPAMATAYNLEDDYNIYPLDALSQHGGTGIWFITPEADIEENRNIMHLVDTERSDTNDISLLLSPDCRTMELLYETLHGVLVKDFRLFASNLICSNFETILETKTPHKDTLPSIPCYNTKVRELFTDWNVESASCTIKAGFEITAEYLNEAIGYDPIGEEIVEIEAGNELEAGHLAVYEFQITDTTSGIAPNLLSSTTYSYAVTTSDGLSFTLTDKNPILQYTGDAAGITFNIIQTVTSGTCVSTFNASKHYETDFPFEMLGDCDDITPEINGSITDTEGVFTLTLVDNSVYTDGDSSDSYEIYVHETGELEPETPTYTELPDEEVISDFSENGWTIKVVITSSLGCKTTVTTDVDAAGAVNAT